MEEKKLNSPKKLNLDSNAPEIIIEGLKLRKDQSSSSKKQENEEDDYVERSYSPSKYFGKRPSFEFKNLKNIEKPSLNRQFSEAFFLRQEKQEKEENLKVKFVGEVLIGDQINNDPFKKEKIAKKKTILKKTHFVEELKLEDIFDKDDCAEIIDKIKQQSEEEKRDFKEILKINFFEYWDQHHKNNDEIIKFLKGIKIENMDLIFKESIDLNLLLSVIFKLKSNLENEPKLVSDYLEHFPRIHKFDVVISCLLAKEKQEIKDMIDKLEQKQLINQKKKTSLLKVYFVE